MTTQFGERILYKGEETQMETRPLSEYLQTRDDIRFKSPSTACRRGYYGQWEIKDNKLYLIDLVAFLKDYEKVGLTYLFPGQDEVFANWFTGIISIPTGELLKDVHRGYGLTYEKDILLHFKEGVLIKEEEVDNRE